MPRRDKPTNRKSNRKSGYAAPNCQKFLHLTEHAHLVQPRDDAGPTGLGLGYHNCCITYAISSTCQGRPVLRSRGEIEKRIKEQLCLFADQLSAETLCANQLRVYFSATALTGVIGTIHGPLF